MDLLRARKLVPVWTTALLLGGCALSHLDLNGGAHVVSTHIADTDLKLFIDDTHPLTLTLVYDDGFEESAQQDSVAWSLDAPGVAAIDGNHQVRGRSRGTATLTAEYDKQTATTSIEVSDLPQALEIQTSRRNCAVGQRLSYGALLRYQHGSTEDISARATWLSDDPAVASVDGAGVVTGNRAGDTQVRANFGSLTTTADVHISAAVAVNVDVAPTAVQLTIGLSTALRAQALYSDGRSIDASKIVQWQSASPQIASVASDGTVRGIASGKAMILATRDGVTGSATINVIVPGGG